MGLPSGHSDLKETASVTGNSGGMTVKLKFRGSGDGEKLIRLRNAERVGFENETVGEAAGEA